MKKYMIRKIPIVIVIAAMGIILFSGLVMLLWNGILPAVLHVSAITLWQAAGILLLSKILFGGFRGRRKMWHNAREKRMFWRGMNTGDEQHIGYYACCGRQNRSKVDTEMNDQHAV